jgi:hypothetical protein
MAGWVGGYEDRVSARDERRSTPRERGSSAIRRDQGSVEDLAHLVGHPLRCERLLEEIPGRNCREVPCCGNSSVGYDVVARFGPMNATTRLSDLEKLEPLMPARTDRAR